MKRESLAVSGKFRLMPVLQFKGFDVYNEPIISEEPICKGLALEAPCDEEHYIVIAFIDKDTYRPVETRIEEEVTNWNDVLDFRLLLKVGMSIINQELKKEDME